MRTYKQTTNAAYLLAFIFLYFFPITIWVAVAGLWLRFLYQTIRRVPRSCSIRRHRSLGFDGTDSNAELTRLHEIYLSSANRDYENLFDVTPNSIFHGFLFFGQYGSTINPYLETTMAEP